MTEVSPYLLPCTNTWVNSVKERKSENINFLQVQVLAESTFCISTSSQGIKCIQVTYNSQCTMASISELSMRVSTCTEHSLNNFEPYIRDLLFCES